MLYWVTTLSVIGLALSAATNKIPTKDHSRVHNEELSNEDHFRDEDHNLDYDHEAFLGKEEARTFDQLSPAESKERLSIIIDKIDLDKDGSVTELELKKWIEYTQKRYITEDAQRQWNSYNMENEKLTWENYQTVVYGFMENMDEEDYEDQDANEVSYKEMMSRDQRRWKVADVDQDDALTFEEFSSFLHPEDAVHMKDILVLETMEDIDKNNDSRISLQEYIGDMYKGDDEEQPDWVSSEKEQFNEYRDKNKDGFMDRDEVLAWILPNNYDHAEAEARHLVSESDKNGDGALAKAEILNNYDLFVGSQATDFGEALVRHDEF